MEKQRGIKKDKWGVVRAGEITVAQGPKCKDCGIIRPYFMEKCICLKAKNNEK